MSTVFRVGNASGFSGDRVDAAADQMDARLASAEAAGAALGDQLAAHGTASEELAARITAHVTETRQQLEVLDVSVSASTMRPSASVWIISIVVPLSAVTTSFCL